MISQIESWPDDSARNKCREIIAKLLELHQAGLAQIFSILRNANASYQQVLDECLRDDAVRSLMLLHNLHPESIEHRVRQALDQVRPYLNSHGGDVELLEISPTAVHLRMNGNCHGCPSSAATLHDMIERAICELAPDAGSIEVDGLQSTPAPTGLVHLTLTQELNAVDSASQSPNPTQPATNGHASCPQPPQASPER